jgi:hypothetical protein
VTTGNTVTRLMPFSSAKSHAAFSKSTFDTAYACDHHKTSGTSISRSAGECLVC